MKAGIHPEYKTANDYLRLWPSVARRAPRRVIFTWRFAPTATLSLPANKNWSTPRAGLKSSERNTASRTKIRRRTEAEFDLLAFYATGKGKGRFVSLCPFLFVLSAK